MTATKKRLRRNVVCVPDKPVRNNPPRFPLNDLRERERFNHHIEFADGWEYRKTHALVADHPDGWDFRETQPDGWELNYDRWAQYDELRQGAVRIAPGVLVKEGASGPMFVAHWRRRRGRR